MAKDPSHEQVQHYYFGDPYKEFIASGWEYKERFNSIMMEQMLAE